MNVIETSVRRRADVPVEAREGEDSMRASQPLHPPRGRGGTDDDLTARCVALWRPVKYLGLRYEVQAEGGLSEGHVLQPTGTHEAIVPGVRRRHFTRDLAHEFRRSRPAMMALVGKALAPLRGVVLARGLAWKSSRRSDMAMRGGWRKERQIVPPKHRIPLTAWKLRVGDVVTIIDGRDVGKVGRVLELRPLENRVVVEGVNVQKKHVPSSESETGYEIKHGSIHYSNVALVDPETNLATRVRLRRDASGARVRVARSGALIPWPPRKRTGPGPGEPSPRCTSAVDATEVTCGDYESFLQFLRRQPGWGAEQTGAVPGEVAAPGAAEPAAP